MTEGKRKRTSREREYKYENQVINIDSILFKNKMSRYYEHLHDNNFKNLNEIGKFFL